MRSRAMGLLVAATMVAAACGTWSTAPAATTAPALTPAPTETR
jgi:hypothetical protein